MSRTRARSSTPAHSIPPGTLPSLVVGVVCLAAYQALAPAVPGDKDSGEFRLSHHIDLKTGMYKGRQVIVKREKAEEPEED